MSCIACDVDGIACDVDGITSDVDGITSDVDGITSDVDGCCLSSRTGSCNETIKVLNNKNIEYVCVHHQSENKYFTTCPCFRV